MKTNHQQSPMPIARARRGQFKLRQVTALAVFLAFSGGAAQYAYAGLTGIFGGGTFYKSAGNNITEIENSGLTEAVVWNIEVHANGDLNFNGEFPLCTNGAYIGGSTHPDFAGNMAKLKQGTIKRVSFSVGSSNVGDWQDVKALVNGQGTGSSSILYKNFLALKNAIPAVDAVDFDDENSYDQSSTVQFAVMLGNLGYKVMLDPYQNSSYWTALASAINSQLSGTVDGIHLQSYSGGAGNSPCSFGNFGSIPVYPGLWDQDDSPSQVESLISGWRSSCDTTGGWMWIYDDFVGNGDAAQYARAINDAVAGYDLNNGIVDDGSTFTGGIDGVGSAYSANLLGASLAWNGGVFTFGPASGADAITCAGQTVPVCSARASTLLMLSTAVNGSQTSVTFVVNYSDGTSSTFTQSISDWFTPQNYPGETTVKAMAYRDLSNGIKDNRTFNLYGYGFDINLSKTPASITLPNNGNVKVLSFALSSGVPVSLSSVFNRSNARVSDGTTFTGGLDNDGWACSANMVSSPVNWDDISFNLGPTNSADDVSCAGQVVSLPSGKYSIVNLLATAVNGNQASQSFTVKYSDGSTAAFTVSLSDWFTPQNYTGEAKVIAMAYRDSSTGGSGAGPCYIYGYELATDHTKTLTSLTLPSNANVEVLAITVSP